MTGIFESAVQPSVEEPLPIKNEREMLSEQDSAYNRKLNAEAADQEATTELKRNSARNIMCFMYIWCVVLIILTIMYFVFQWTLQKEIPKEVMIAAFTVTAVIVGLVGYILKGLFGAKN